MMNDEAMYIPETEVVFNTDDDSTVKRGAIVTRICEVVNEIKKYQEELKRIQTYTSMVHDILDNCEREHDQLVDSLIDLYGEIALPEPEDESTFVGTADDCIIV